MKNLEASSKKQLSLSKIHDNIKSEMEKLIKVKSIPDMFMLNLKPFSYYRKLNCEDEIAKYVVLFLIDLNKYFANNHNMSEEQIKMTAATIILDYYYLNLADLKLAFGQMKKEKIFGQLSPNNILDKMERYINERLEIAEQISLNEDNIKSYSEKEISDIYMVIKENGLPEDDKENEIKSERDYKKYKSDYFMGIVNKKDNDEIGKGE